MPAGLVVCGECGTPLTIFAPPAPATGEPSSNVDDAPAVTNTDTETDTDRDTDAEADAESDAVSGVVRGDEVLPVVDAIDEVFPDAMGQGEPADELSPVGERRVWLPVLSRRFVLLTAGGVAGCLIAGGVVWGAFATASAPSPTVPVAATPVGAETVTLPGWATTPALEVAGIDAAAAIDNQVIGVDGQDVSVWDATGVRVGETMLPGDDAAVFAGIVGGEAALVAASTTRAVVWMTAAGTSHEVELQAGERVEVRSGAVALAGDDYSFRILTATAAVPVVAPRPQMIVLGAERERIVWASGAQRLVVASPNGTVLTDAALVAPAPGAKVTPKTGWVKAATPTVTVLGWTLPDGTTVTGIHDTATGTLLDTIPGTGAGFLSPDGTVWVVDGHQVDLSNGTLSPLPDGFIPSAFLGTDLYGALTGGGDALLHAGDDKATPVATSTVRPIAATSDALVALTGHALAVFAPAKTP